MVKWFKIYLFSGFSSRFPVHPASMQTAVKALPKELLSLPLLVAALGYFIDVYDIWIFGANRVASLTEIGVPQEKIFDTGIMLLNMQMAGLFLGGLVFGILGDKYGRTKMMFVSILTYSMATLLNGLVQDVTSYAVFRFVAGFGLAGELGLAVTLISEILPKEKRGYGTGIVVGFGVFGALAAALLAHYIPWRASFIIGGLAGLALLIFRIKVSESKLFEEGKSESNRGNIALIFSSRERFTKFFWCVCMVLPVWYAAGVLVTFGPELMKAKYGYEVAAATLMVWFNLFLALSDFASAWISQGIKSRKKVLAAFIGLGFGMTAALLLSPGTLPLPFIIFLYIGIAVGGGCWVLGVTTAAESFGTNLRATVTTLVPNLSRAGTIPMTLGLAALKDHMDYSHAAMIVGAVVFSLALMGALLIPETYAKNLDYKEE
jgi:putative MFS transporter